MSQTTVSPEKPQPIAVKKPAQQTNVFARIVGSRYGAGAVSPTIFAIVLIFFAIWLAGSFLNFNSRVLDLHQNTPVLIAALALCLCMIAGQFDLSIGGMATLSCFLSIGLTVRQDIPFGVSVLMCLAIGAILGLVNSWLVMRLRVNAFIATLATGGVVAGLAQVYSGGTQLVPTDADPGQLPVWFSGAGSIGNFQSKVPIVITIVLVLVLFAALALVLSESFSIERLKRNRRVAGVVCGVLGVTLSIVLVVTGTSVPWTVFILVVITLLLWVMLRYTQLGRGLYAIGSNSTAAGLAGVRVGRNTTIVFVLSGLLSSFAGIVLAANLGSASPDIAVPYLLPSFAAVFLSTVLFSNGRFHVWGTVLGGYLLVTVSQGLIIGGLDFTWTAVVNGIVLAAAVAFSTLLRRRR